MSEFLSPESAPKKSSCESFATPLLTDKDVVEFQQLFEKETGQPLSEEQARTYAGALVSLVDIFISILP